MIKVLIYLFPILINFLSGSMFYVTANRFTEAGAEKVYVSSTSAAWALTYFIGSLVVGRLVTERRAVPMIIAAAFLLSAFSVAFIVFPNVYLQFLWIALVGAAMAVYCTPFQVFMKRIGGGASGVVYSTAMYTWSWSFGNALGPFVFGFLPSWQSAFAVNAAIAFGLALLVIWTNAYLKRHQPAGDAAQASDGLPMPASTMIGRSISSIRIWMKSLVASPRLLPIGEASGMMAAAPAFCISRAAFRSGYIYGRTTKPSLARISMHLTVS